MSMIHKTPNKIKFNLGATIHYLNLRGEITGVLPEDNYRVSFNTFYYYNGENRIMSIDTPFDKIIHYDDLGLNRLGHLGANKDGTYIKWSEYGYDD